MKATQRLPGLSRRKLGVIQGTGDTRAVWSPVNCAWLILWGTRPEVLAIKNTRWEAKDYMKEIGAL